MNKNTLINIGVWISRLIVGGAFIFSGFTKGIDPWGTIYKLEQYSSVWDLSQPRSLLLFFTILLCVGEFLIGVSLVTGSYRRSTPRIAVLFISFFLVLTAYIAFVSPIDDCGCFGDALVISNWATFWKNVILAALIIYLVIYNGRVPGLFNFLIQWVAMVLSLFYILAVGLIGYFVQPLIDFRPYSKGVPLNDIEEPSPRFIYEKDGKRKEFDATNLPDTAEGWKYVERIDPPRHILPLIIEDNTGDDITDIVLDDDQEQLIIVIPELRNADISTTMYLNRISGVAHTYGIDVFALIGSENPKDLERWEDISMASYPIFLADGTLLKTIVRGETSLIYLNNGKIEGKTSMSLVSNGRIKELENGKISVKDLVSFDEGRCLRWLTRIYIIILVLLMLISFPVKYKLYHLRKRGNKK